MNDILCYVIKWQLLLFVFIIFLLNFINLMSENLRNILAVGFESGIYIEWLFNDFQDAQETCTENGMLK